MSCPVCGQDECCCQADLFDAFMGGGPEDRDPEYEPHHIPPPVDKPANDE